MPKFTVKTEVYNKEKIFVAVARCCVDGSNVSCRRYKTHGGGEVVRVKISLACTECKQRNYNMTKEKKNHPERLETKKYCKFCRTHTLHKETK